MGRDCYLFIDFFNLAVPNPISTNLAVLTRKKEMHCYTHEEFRIDLSEVATTTALGNTPAVSYFQISVNGSAQDIAADILLSCFTSWSWRFCALITFSQRLLNEEIPVPQNTNRLLSTS
jgi:hypothetical protein